MFGRVGEEESEIMTSILVTEPNVCYICRRVGYTEIHHVLYGALRKIADDNGLTCYLCYECHRGTKGVHGRDGNALNRYLKAHVQTEYEKLHSHEEWMELVGRSYI